MQQLGDKELDLDRFAPAFGTQLLGMHCTPQFVIEQNAKYGLITHHSYDGFNLHSRFLYEEISIQLDGNSTSVEFSAERKLNIPPRR